MTIFHMLKPPVGDLRWKAPREILDSDESN